MFAVVLASACTVHAPAALASHPRKRTTATPAAKSPVDSVRRSPAGPNLADNGSFENTLDGWQPLWTRDPNQGLAEVVSEPHRAGKGALRVEHSGTDDWALSQQRAIAVSPGDIYEYGGYVKTIGVTEEVAISVVTKAADGTVLDWFWSEKQATGTHDWKRLEGRFLVPPECATVQLRITGLGPGTSFWDEVHLNKRPAPPGRRQPFDLERGGTRLRFDPATNQLQIADRQGTVRWQLAGFGRTTGVLSNTSEGASANLQLFDPEDGTLAARVALEANGDVVFRIEGSGKLDGRFEFPGTLAASPGQSWVLPINEGLLVPVEDTTFDWRNAYALYSGHGFSMPFIGLTDGTNGLLMIAETPDDALVVTRPPAGQAAGSSAAFAWQPSRGTWRYERRVRIRRVHGGYVEIAKAYRDYARGRGLVVTLAEKARYNPNVEALIGAADIWWWKDGPLWTKDPEPERAAAMLKEAGVERALWSNGGTPAALRAITALGYLVGRYDIVQDVWSPDTPLPWVSHEGWPDGLVLEPDGTWLRGWVARDGNARYPGGVICSKYGLGMLEKRVRAELEDHPYQARFLDTTTASPLRECYNPAHPESRSDDRRAKLAQLEFLSKRMKLVTGSETGMDMAVPAVHYFEGMMSLGPYRLEDSGYDLFSPKKPSPGFLTFQVGTRYRIPLFELVYHDCIVSYWYWGDASNRLPEFWLRRDQFNALYATPPVYVLDRTTFAKQRALLGKSYRRATKTARKLGKLEMLSHEFLDETHSLQRTRFAGGAEVVANFGDVSVMLPNGVRVGAHDYVLQLPTGRTR